MTEAPWRGRRIHLVGVGGAGMSAYARAAAALGAVVSGSDAVAGAGTEVLAADGVLRVRGEVPLGEHRVDDRLDCRRRAVLESVKAELQSQVTRGKKRVASKSHSR